ncbi:MAG: hypothetical protein ACJ79W_27145, partial [Myxococcales bacterium]
MSANRLACVLVALASSCNRSAAEVRQGESAQGAAKQTGIDLDGLDPSIAPGDDFFGYANGTWLKKTEIPADRS